MRLLALCLPDTPCSRRDLTESDLELDWTILLELAKWHGMMPLLAARLLAGAMPSTLRIPPVAMASLRTYQERHLFRSVTLTAALIELQAAIASAGLRIVAWKGPSVGLLLYGSATLRESADLDFLFLEEDLQQVLQITRGLGYKLLGNSDSESKDIYILTLEREFTFGRHADQVALEFHLQVLPSRFTLWQDSQADVRRASTICPLAHVRLLMQSPEDLLVSLCAHATKHNWDRMKWACDIARFLHVYAGQIAWLPFLARLRGARKEAVVLLGLALTADLFTLDLPGNIRTALQVNPGVATLAGVLAAHILGGSADPVDVRHRRAVIALLCPRLRDRIAYILRPLVELNYEDLVISVGNRTFFFLNYVFRVGRLLRKYGPHRLASKTASSVRSVR